MRNVQPFIVGRKFIFILLVRDLQPATACIYSVALRQIAPTDRMQWDRSRHESRESSREGEFIEMQSISTLLWRCPTQTAASTKRRISQASGGKIYFYSPITR